MLRGLKHTLCTPGPRDPQRLRQSCVWASPEEVPVSSGLPQGQGLWVQQTWVWYKPSWRRLPLTHHRAQNYTGLGKQTLRGHKQNLETPGPRREEQWPHKRLTQTCPAVSGTLRQRCGSEVGCCRVRGTEWGSGAWDLLREVTIIFITSTIVWPQVNNRRGTQPHPSTENWIKDLLSMAPPIRTRPSFPFNQSLSSGSFHKPLILFHQTADRLKTTITEN